MFKYNSTQYQNLCVVQSTKYTPISFTNRIKFAAYLNYKEIKCKIYNKQTSKKFRKT